jgi:mannose-6-phosphate isomerase-like protein (cupin superfamily)
MKILSVASLPHGRFEGAGDGPASISMILAQSDPGGGPRRHRHPYDDTWAIEEGNVPFRVGDVLKEAGPGDIVLAPTRVPHKFTNQGPRRARLICIHASPTIVGEILEEAGHQ